MSGAPEQVTESLDLKGEVCPYTFVKTKLALEELQSGQALRVIVDNPGSATNVPRSLRSEGHIVADATKLNDADWADHDNKGLTRRVKVSRGRESRQRGHG